MFINFVAIEIVTTLIYIVYNQYCTIIQEHYALSRLQHSFADCMVSLCITVTRLYTWSGLKFATLSAISQVTGKKQQTKTNKQTNKQHLQIMHS